LAFAGAEVTNKPSVTHQGPGISKTFNRRIVFLIKDITYRRQKPAADPRFACKSAQIRRSKIKPVMHEIRGLGPAAKGWVMDSQMSNSDSGSKVRSGGPDRLQQQMLPGQVKKPADPASPIMQPDRLVTGPSPKDKRSTDARAIQAHVDRRRRLAERIKAERPSYTQDEIEARLEQFGL
jgi:hypothetical protein